MQSPERVERSGARCPGCLACVCEDNSRGTLKLTTERPLSVCDHKSGSARIDCSVLPFTREVKDGVDALFRLITPSPLKHTGLHMTLAMARNRLSKAASTSKICGNWRFMCENKLCVVYCCAVCATTRLTCEALVPVELPCPP